MKKTLVLTTALAAMMAAPTFAGGMADPVMTADIIVQDVSTPSSGTAMLPFIIFALLVAVSNG